MKEASESGLEKVNLEIERALLQNVSRIVQAFGKKFLNRAQNGDLDAMDIVIGCAEFVRKVDNI